MLEILSKLKFIFDQNQKKKTFLLLFAVLIGVLLEMLSIGLIIPILTLMSDQGANRFIDVEKFASFFPFVSISDHKDMVFFFHLFIINCLFFKNFFLNLFVTVSIKICKRFTRQYIF